MAGNSYTAAEINNRAGSLVYGVWQALDAAHQFKLWLDDASHNDAAIGPGGIGVTTADLTIIRNSFSDLGGATGLWAVSHGTYDAPGVNNFFSNAKLLSGLNYTG